MSELKDYSILDIEAIDDERFIKEKAAGKWVPESRVYLKEDVDAIIADLKAQVNGFKNRANLWEYNAQNEHNAAVAVRMENAKLKAKLAEKDKKIAELKEQYKDMDVTHTVHIAKMNAKIEELEELEESHKKEVGQFLIETKRLENLCASYRHDCDYLAIREANALKEIGRDNRVIRHHKYKRCLAMAEMCNAMYDKEDAKVNGCGTSWEYISKEMKYWERWRNRWLKIAEQFKDKEA